MTTKYQKTVKNAPNNDPYNKTAGPESKDISFTTISNRETQEIGTFEKLETVNV